MSDPVRIVAIAGDPGGGEALAPVLTALLAGDAILQAYAYAQTTAVWEKCAIPHQVLSDATDPATCADILLRSRADLLLSATSMNGLDLEQKFVAAARIAGIPSLSVLDWWSNYRGRFADGQGEGTTLPDRIAVMDEKARRELIAEGFEENHLVVTGQPAFGEVVKWKNAAPKTTRQRVRGEFGVTDSTVFVVFGSQPLSRLAGGSAASEERIGYSEQTVIPLLIAALEKFADRSGRAVTLLVRPHPRESVSEYAGLKSPKIDILVSPDGHRREVALAADLVAGMNSAFLLEACLLGCPTISLQPGLRQVDTLPTNSAGLSQAVYDAADVLPAVSRMLLDPASCTSIPKISEFSSVSRDATSNIVGLIHQMIRSSCHVH